MNHAPYPLMGVFGGTFDPIHDGHLHVAKHVYQHCDFASFSFIPSHQPPHRQSHANAQARLEMLQLALQPYPQFSINEIEMQRTGPSYTLDTIKALKQQHPEHALALVLGYDALIHLNEWHGWQQLIKLCHIIAVNRPSIDDSKAPWLIDFLEQHQTMQSKDLYQADHGHVFFVNIPPSNINATTIRRQLLQQGKNIEGLAIPVYNYIQANALYT